MILVPANRLDSLHSFDRCVKYKRSVAFLRKRGIYHAIEFGEMARNCLKLAFPRHFTKIFWEN